MALWGRSRTTGLTGHQIIPGTVRPQTLSTGIIKQTYFYTRFAGTPAFFKVDANGTPSGAFGAGAAQGETNFGMDNAGHYWELFQTTAQTIGPLAHADGWNISGDLVDNEALELVPGGNLVNNPLARTMGTTPNFFHSLTFKATDADGSDQFILGMRKQEAFAVPTSFLTTGDGVYTDFVGIGFAKAVANPNPISVTSDLNNSGSATVSQVGFTVANGVPIQLTQVFRGRVATFYINGVKLGGVVSKDALGAAITAQQTLPPHTFTADSGDLYLPFIHLRHDAAVSEGLVLMDYEAGLLVDVGEDPDDPGKLGT